MIGEISGVEENAYGNALFVSARLDWYCTGGRHVARRNLEHLRRVFGWRNTHVYRLHRQKRLLTSRLLAVTLGDLISIRRLVRQQRVTVLFIDDSRFGVVATLIRLSTSVAVVSFFHDVLPLWHKSISRKSGLVQRMHSLRYYLWELLTSHASHLIMALTEEDGAAIGRLYGQSNIAILPVSLPETDQEGPIHPPVAGTRPLTSDTVRLLFVGNDYTPNVEAMDWFVKEILPQIKATLVIVGNKLERYTGRWPGVTVHGRVDSLGPYYDSADVVVIPLLSGGGMKVKTSEALSHGKPVVGTDEALRGYPRVPGVLEGANTPAEFKLAIARLGTSGSQERARALYREHFSYEATYPLFTAAISRLLETRSFTRRNTTSS